MKMKSCGWIEMMLVIIGIFFIGNVKSENEHEKGNAVCKQKVLWKMRMCPDGKLICSKNKEYVEKAKHYIKALGSPNYTRRVKAYNKLMEIAHYILPYIKGEYKKAKNLNQSYALIGYRSLNILKDVDIRIMCEDGKGGFMWYAVILKGAVKTSAPRGFVSLGFILVGNEAGMIGGVQVKGSTKDWYVSNYSCKLGNKSIPEFEINDGGYSYVIRDNTYYENSSIISSPIPYKIVSNDRGKKKVVIYGKESKEYDDIDGRIVLSSSEKRYGFIAKKENGKWVAVIDGKESEEYDSIFKLEFNPSGNKYGFIAKKQNGKYVAVIDGKESEEYDSIPTASISFSSSGNRYGFVAVKENGKFVAVIDGKENEEYIGVGEIVFSSSGSKYGFLACKRNGKRVTVIDGTESEEYKYNYNYARGLVLSSSGNRYGFVAQKENDKWVAVIDGKESKEYDYIGQIEFSPSGDRYGFMAKKENGKWVVVIDGKESKEYEKIEYTRINDRDELIYYKPFWSSSDKLSAFVGRLKGSGGSDMCEVVVNNHPVRTTNCTLDFYSHKNTLKFIEFRNNKIYSVSCKLK